MRRMHAYMVGLVLGGAIALGVPWCKSRLETWIGNIVLQAVHQHYQWQQAQLRAKPLIELLPPSGGSEM